MVSIFIPVSCRFVPSCSNYAIQSITKYGAARGGLFAFLRLCKCHPFYNKTGHDPVP